MSSAPVFKKKGAGKREVRPRHGAAGPSSEAITGADVADNVASSSRAHDSVSTHHSDTDEPSVVVHKKRKFALASGNPLVQGTFSRGTGSRSRNGNGSSDEEDDDDLYGGNTFRSGSNVVSATQDARQDATRSSAWYDEGKSGESSTAAASSSAMDGVYRGKAGYSKFTTEHDNGMSAKLKAATKGPVKGGNSNVRTITMVDYQPDVCKDYKETGYCGFGDTCKFLHDRSDYLAGWQLDSLSSGGRRREALLDEEDETQEDEDIPFACLICRQPFTDPVVTKCGHFFCSACAIKRFAKTSKCFACGKQTQGIFNSAQKILDRMEKVRALKQEERDEKRWDREDVGGDDGQEQMTGELLEGVEIDRDGSE